jgi:VWFA-related protein
MHLVLLGMLLTYIDISLNYKRFYIMELFEHVVDEWGNNWSKGRLRMKRNGNFLLLCSFFLIFTGMIVGCSGSVGNNDDKNDLNPDQHQTGNLQLCKSTYNFGNVTLGNAATLSVTISNVGTANLSITDITLSDNNNFTIDPNECGSGPYTVAAGLSCAVIVTFSPTAEGSYSETLSITSDDTDTPTAAATLTGEGKTISAYTVALNQIETNCPTDTVTAYVSVTDQDGFAVTDLTLDDFSISEDGGAAIAPDAVNFTESTSLPLSVAILMDYSGSIYEVTNLVETIENSVANFVNAMGTADQAEIIKFASEVQQTQVFTADKDLLNWKIYEVPVNIGRETALYDAIYMGVENAAATDTHRRAVLVLTDGQDQGPGCQPGSQHTIDEAIELGKNLGVPVFTVGVGEDVDEDVLQRIASETGGEFFDAPDADRLQTIYSQLSDILNNQYILTYTSVGTGANVNTVVSVQHDTGDGGVLSDDSNVLTYSSCP